MQLDSVVCGHCLDVMKGVPNNSIDLIVTSPPYNTGKDYDSFSDEMPWFDWYAFIRRFVRSCYRVLRVGGVLALNVLKEARWQRDHRFADTWSDYDPDYVTHRGAQKNVKGKGRVEPVFNQVYSIVRSEAFKMRESIVWVKGNLTDERIDTVSTNYQMGCDSDPYLRGTAEMIILGSKGRWYHNGGTGRRGAEAMPFELFTKDVWVIPSVTSDDHPAPFPEEIPTRLIRLFVHRSNTQDLPEPVVADFFIGEGTTAIAALKLGCRFYGCDISPRYVKLANRNVERVRLEMSQMRMGI